MTAEAGGVVDRRGAGASAPPPAKGTAYLSLRALAKDASTNLNVRWNNRTYAFELRESAEPLYSVVLQSRPEKENRIARPLTPPRLLGLLDKAKAFAAGNTAARYLRCRSNIAICTSSH